MEHVVDGVLLIAVTLLFLIMAVAMVVPPRPMDGLSIALTALFALFTVAYGLGLLQWLGLFPVPSPAWVRWTLRGVYVPIEIAVLVELWRARRKKEV